MLKTAEVTLQNRLIDAKANALFDLGANKSFIKSSLAHQLQLSIIGFESVDLGVFGEDNFKTRTFPVTEAKLATSDQPIHIRLLITNRISSNMKNYNRKLLMERFPDISNLQLAPQCSGDPYELHLLIGADHYWDISNDRILRTSGPVCIDTKIGHLLSGPTDSQRHRHRSSELNQIMEVVCADTDSLDLTQYWSLESLGINPTDDEPHDFDMNDYIQNRIIFEDGRYVAGLPWKTHHPELPTNHSITQHLTRKMIRGLSPTKLAQYDLVIQEQITRNYIEVSTEQNPTKGHYLTHHAVEKDSATTPIRVVYRCNFSTGHNPSLNDCLEAGTSLQSDLGAIISRFRLYNFAMMTDVEKAFLRVILSEADRPYTKFFWLSDPSNPESEFVTYRFKSVLFGATSSPFILNAVLTKHLNSIDTPVSRLLMKNIYVDNLLLSVPTSDEALILYKESVQILHDAGFNLRAWSSNSSELDKLSKADNRSAPDSDNIGALGLIWNKSEDYLKCKNLPALDTSKPPTIRTVLSDTARLFDVTGFLLPVHTQAKIFLQDLHKANMQKNCPLTKDQTTHWMKIHGELVAATKNIRWSRQPITNLTPTTPTELHVFADASLRSLGCCAYLVVNGQSALIWAKNKLTPLSGSLRIPRFDLNGLVLASVLVDYLTKNLDLNITKRILWSDSQIALHWIKSSKKKDSYVTRRCEIIKNAKFDDIRYVPSRDNPADLITKGLSASQLESTALWWNGLDWLHTGDKPQTSIFTSHCFATLNSVVTFTPLSTIQEEICTPECVNNVTSIIDRERFSKLSKLFKTTVFVTRFIRKISQNVLKGRKIEGTESGNLQPSVTELCTARNLWISKVQSEHFQSEYQSILSGNRKAS